MFEENMYLVSVRQCVCVCSFGVFKAVFGVVVEMGGRRFKRKRKRSEK